MFTYILFQDSLISKFDFCGSEFSRVRRVSQTKVWTPMRDLHALISTRICDEGFLRQAGDCKLVTEVKVYFCLFYFPQIIRAAGL